jgi:single-stranded-DNA-specific exonuclease
MPTLRGLTRLWNLPIEVGIAATVAGLDPVVARVLAARGLADPGAAAAFLEPTLRQLHDPGLIPDLDRAAERTLAAVRAGERVVIYGDYDVDGVTATAILYHTILTICPTADLRTYVPHRIDEGYGLHSAAIAQLASEGAKIIVSVDCGITAKAPALVAKQCGVDLIITDHHNPPASLEDLPEAFAVVHPRRPDSAYPFGDLCGAGVAYKLAWRLATLHCGSDRVDGRLRMLLVELLAFAALGAIADVVPLIGENRVIARFGLQRIKHSSFVGLRALVQAAGLAGEDIDSERVGFILAPRLNACGRMGHAREAVELLTSAPPERAAQIATQLTCLNDERRATEQRIADEAATMAQDRGMTGPDRRAIVLASEGWHAGVVGIVCSRLVERFCRPTILLSRGEPGEPVDGAAGIVQCHGSGRSIDGFNLYEALHACAPLLLSFGGHDMAAGLRLEASRLEEFTAAFTAYTNERIPAERLVHSLRIDADAEIAELTPRAVDGLGLLAPFGRGNPTVRLRLRGVQLVNRPEPLGREGKHLAFTVRQGPAMLRLLAWSWGTRKETFAPGSALDVVITPKLNRWNGRVSVEPELLDLRVRQ